MASDALWFVSFKCVVKGYQDCSFNVREDENFDVLKKIGENDEFVLLCSVFFTAIDSWFFY